MTVVINSFKILRAQHDFSQPLFNIALIIISILTFESFTVAQCYLFVALATRKIAGVFHDFTTRNLKLKQIISPKWDAFRIFRWLTG